MEAESRHRIVTVVIVFLSRVTLNRMSGCREWMGEKIKTGRHHHCWSDRPLAMVEKLEYIDQQVKILFCCRLKQLYADDLLQKIYK